MFALGLHYLNGWSMAASDGPRKEQAEWPPHPDRVFMALAAAWFETGEDAEEGAALRWLERLDPPAIAASDACQRTPVVGYVPVNDDGHKKISNPKTEVDGLKKRGLALIPEYRSRQERRFPVAIPHDPTVHLIWPGALDGHGNALRRLATKVTHVGHSASLVQAWIEDTPGIPATWVPTEGVAERRLRVPSADRLARLAALANRDAQTTYLDLRDEIARAKTDLTAMKQPPRVPWRDFPDAVLLASERETKTHPEYAAAKSGNATAAARLVDALVDKPGLAKIRALCAGRLELPPVLASVHAYEREGFNAIPTALAELISERLGIAFDSEIVQTNIVGHTGADGYGRLARQAAFDGAVTSGCEYLIVDDFIGQGGTLANLRGWVEKQRGNVIGAVGLTGRAYSAKLNLTQEQLDELREKHGPEFERWWRERFGHAFDCLTQSEARYLARSPDADTIRDRLAAAMREGSRRCNARSPREQRQHIKELNARLKERFPDGAPRATMRPSAEKWQGYTRPQEPPPASAAGSTFDPNIIVLAIEGRRVSLPATLRLTAALRSVLMREFSPQRPPEWFSGHRADGRPSADPHLALIPLAFVGSVHADGSIVGLGIVVPSASQPQEVGRTLEPILRDIRTGLPRDDLRLFDGQWFECSVQLESRERPPQNLQRETWTRASRFWASVTPVVFNRHFDGEAKWERAAESVKDACSHIGLPRPVEVLLHPVSLLEGVPHAREFPQLVRKRDGGRQMHAHAVVIFEEPVVGPVLIGAGRFRGYGLCRPLDTGKASETRGPTA